MPAISDIFETFWNSLLLVPKTLLALFPLYNTLSSFRQDLLAAALGVSPIVIWFLSKVFSAVKFYLGVR